MMSKYDKEKKQIADKVFQEKFGESYDYNESLQIDRKDLTRIFNKFAEDKDSTKEFESFLHFILGGKYEVHNEC